MAHVGAYKGSKHSRNSHLVREIDRLILGSTCELRFPHE